MGQWLTSLGIGQALVTVLSPMGVPTPLAPTHVVPPDSSMAALSADQLDARVKSGTLYSKYAQTIDPQSAHEIISARIAAAQAAAARQGSAYAGVPGGLTPAQAQAAQREAEREARAEAKREEADRRAQQRANLQREREITQVGTTVLRGVLGTLLGGRRR